MKVAWRHINDEWKKKTGKVSEFSAIEDSSLSPAQRKHWDEMEKKQAAKEQLKSDAEAKALQDRAESLRDAGNAMDKARNNFTHQLGAIWDR